MKNSGYKSKKSELKPPNLALFICSSRFAPARISMIHAESTLQLQTSPSPACTAGSPWNLEQSDVTYYHRKIVAIPTPNIETFSFKPYGCQPKNRGFSPKMDGL